jgi:histone deacetylase 1/2
MDAAVSMDHFVKDTDEFMVTTPTPFTPTHKRVAYFYDQDVGNYVYYLGHPMKPHRIRMAHNLIVMYGMCEDEASKADEEEEGLRRMNDPIYGAGGLANGNGNGIGRVDNADEIYDKAVARGARSTRMQCFRPRRANKNDMTRFHTDEYVELLELVNPDNGESLTGGGTRCKLDRPVGYGDS